MRVKMDISGPVTWMSFHFSIIEILSKQSLFKKMVVSMSWERRQTRDSEDCVFPAGSNHVTMTDHPGIDHITVIIIIYIYREFNFLSQR